MAKEVKYDVHIRVGFAFIGLCALIGFFFGAVIPWNADQSGLLHLGGLGKGIHHLATKDVMVDGCLGAFFGLVNGVALSIRKELWFVGFVISIIPCGIFGGFAASATPQGYSSAANALTYWMIPVIICAASISLRRNIWAKYQKPVVSKSKSSG